MLGRLDGPGHPVGRVQVVVFPRCDVGRVGTAEADGDVKRLAAAHGLFEMLESLPGDLAVPRVGVVGVEHDAAALHFADDLLFGRLLRLFRLAEVEVPRRRIFERIAGVEDLAELLHAPAMPQEELRQHHSVVQEGARRGNVIDDARRVRPLAAQERGPRGIADGIIAEGAVEPHAPRRQAVDVRRPDDPVAVAAQINVQVVGDDLEDVQPRSGRLVGMHGNRQGRQAEHEQKHRRSLHCRIRSPTSGRHRGGTLSTPAGRFRTGPPRRVRPVYRAGWLVPRRSRNSLSAEIRRQ